MSRLLFAAARGARVQRQQEAINSSRTWWEDVAIQWGLDDELRIHPDDKHLQYGPISSALRDGAKDVPHKLFPIELGPIKAAFPLADWVCYEALDDDKGELHRSLFLLFLAEALADEGL